MAATRAKILPSSVDFAAREAVISRLEADYDASLSQIDELNARLEACLAVLTGKPATQAPTAAPAVATVPEINVSERKAAQACTGFCSGFCGGTLSLS